MQKRILVVDDDSMNLVRTKMILGKYYEVLFAESGIEALDMNGIETFEHMKEFASDIPVIFLTASGQETDVVSAIKLGAVNYLKKPFQPHELMKRVAQEFERK